MKVSLVLLASLLFTFSTMGEAVEPLVNFAEIDAVRAPYQRNVAALRANRDARVGQITRSYLANLERLQKETTARGDLDGALLVKAERERVQAADEPSADERKAMPAPLAAQRTRFEQEIGPIGVETRKQEETQTRSYLTALDTLQKRLTTQNQIDKALAVKRERDRVAASASVASAAPVATVGTGVVAPTAPTTGSGAKLDPALGDRIAAAVKGGSVLQTESSGEPGGGKDIPEEGALLVGFEFLETPGGGVRDVRSLRPIYLTKEGILAGKDRGKLEEVTDKVQARAGYAVGGVVTYHNTSRIQGIQVIFMKIDLRTGRLDMAPANAYKSKWFGSRGRGAGKQLGGDGRLVVGVYGKTGADADTIGLVQLQ
jgi:hypothetical protein